MNKFDVIIIGAGPAGMNTALYTQRSHLKTLILDKGMYGGQLNNTLEVENYIGVGKISGMELAESMYQQIEDLGVEYQYGELLSITKEGDLFIVVTDVETYQAYSVVIATGTEHRKLGIQGELEYSGKGVSYCAICDGAFFKDGKIVVVGGGDSALEEGEYLTNYGKTVSLIHRRDKLRGTKILQDRFINKENTELIFNSQVTNIIGDGSSVTHVELTDVDGNITKHEANGVFIYIGLDPNTKQLLDLGITDSEGYILTDDKMQTNISGLFAVGDVRKKELRQIATAVGDGSICGTSIYNYITNLKD